jgi:Ulp1 protease family, C-terminal catalytic domain
MENIETVSTDDINMHKEDKKCAKGREFKNGSCFETNELLDIVDAHNKTHQNDKINIKLDQNTIDKVKDNLEEHKNKRGGKHSYKDMYIKYNEKLKKFLLKKIDEKLGDKCSTQKCWTEQQFMENMDEDKREHIQRFVLRPYGPSKGRKWLNTLNIDDVIDQFEKIHTDFYYLGTMPRDFQNHEELKQTKDFYKNLFNEGKTKLGMVYNTDKLGESGEHWNAMFCDLKKGHIYFFDSYGVDPNQETQEHMKLLKEVVQELCSETATISYNHNKLCNKVNMKVNDKRHQFKGSECGVYSIHFIENMLDGISFEEASNARIPDDEINKKRDIYFYKEE